MTQNRQRRIFPVHRIALVCAVAVTLAVSRTSTASVPRVSASLKTAIHCPSTHAKRQSLDRDGGVDFSLPLQTSHVSPPLASFLCLSCTDESLLPFQPDSYHHNRPPPLT